MTAIASAHRRAGELAVVAGLMVLSGWWLAITPLTTFLWSWPSIKPNTALAFILAGVALRCLPDNPQQRAGTALRQVGIGCALAAALIGALTMVEYVGHMDLGIDGLLSRGALEPGDAAVSVRMAVATAAGLTLLGGGLALLYGEQATSLAQSALVTVVALFAVPLLNSFYSLELGDVRTYDPFISLAIPTSLLFIIVAAGGLSARATHGFMRTAAGPGLGAESIRRLFPQALIALFMLGWLIAWGEWHGYYDTALGAAILIAAASAAIGLALWHNAHRLERTEAERDRFFTLGLDLLGIADFTGHFRRINPAFRSVLGWEAEEILARPFLHFVHPDDRAGTLAEMEKLRHGTLTLHFENRCVCKNGSWRCLSWTSVPIVSEGLVYASARDVTELRNAQESVQRSEQDLAVTLQSIGDAVLATDAAGRVTRMNPVAERLTGWPQHEATGHPVDEIFRIINEETREPAAVPVEEVRRTGELHGLANHTVLIARDGTERPIAHSAAPIRSRDGSVAGVVLIFRDSTDERAAAQALAETNADLERRVQQRAAALAEADRFSRATLDALTAHIAVLDADGTILAVNDAWRHFSTCHGLTPGQAGEGVNYLAVCDRASGDDATEAHAMAAAIRDVIAGRRDLFTLQYPCHSPDEQRWFYCRVSRFPDDGAVRVVVSHQDVTLEREARENLNKSEQRFESLFEAAPDATVITNSQGIITLVNGQAERMFGWTRSEMVGRPVEMLMPSASRSGHVGRREHYAQPGVAARAMGAGRTLLAVGKNGTEFPVEISLSPMTSDGVTVVAASVRDISARAQLEAQFLQSQKMETVGQLAGGIAHDFNNLITVISGTSELATERLPEGHPLREDFTSIYAAATTAAALTRQLLAFSRKQILQPVIVNIDTIVASSEVILRRLLGEHVKLIVLHGDEAATVRVDPGQVEQVILNLAINARDAMQGGGTLTIATGSVVLDETYVGTHTGVTPGRYVLLTVSDTGTGIDKATQERMFEPFFTTKEPGKGTGLGLSTSYGIVKQSGGDIRVYSELGKGTTIKVYLPRAGGAPLATGAPGTAASARGTETILLVEDDDAIRHVARRMLAAAGYTVLPAGSAIEALRVAQQRESPIHLLLTDVVMPGLSGRDLAQKFEASHPEMKVLFTSGYTDDAIVHHGVLDASVHFIGKPYSSAALTHKVREVLDAPS